MAQNLPLAADEVVSIVSFEHRSESNQFFTVFFVKFRGRTVARRYSEFSALHKILAGLFPVQMNSFNVRLPKKAFFNREPKFLEERRVLLENYLRHLMLVPEFRSSAALRNFLQGKAGQGETAVVFVPSGFGRDNGVAFDTNGTTSTTTKAIQPLTPQTIPDDDIDNLMQQVRYSTISLQPETSSGFI